MATMMTALNGATAFTATAVPVLGNINKYNASAGAISSTLPPLASQNVGAYCIVEKDSTDLTYNTATFTTTSGDFFDDTISTTLILNVPGEKRQLQVVSISGTKYWKVTNESLIKHGLAAAAAQVSVTNTTTATDVTPSWTLPAGKLAAGSAFRIKLKGTVQVTSTSGTLTFTPYIQGTALAQTAVMATQTSAAGPVAFTLEFDISVRTTGSSGTAIATPWGIVNFTTPAYLTSTSASTTTVNTTSAASSNVIKVQATWGTANAANSLLVQTATIERVI
jgi:hypothetical protein